MPFGQQLDPVACINPQHIPHQSQSFLLCLGHIVAPTSSKKHAAVVSLARSIALVPGTEALTAVEARQCTPCK